MGDQNPDVFIFHASEDKEPVVDTLAQQLDAVGVDVWYDDEQIVLGDSLIDSLDEGLSNTRYGVVVLSENFIDKKWPESELNAMIQRLQQDKVKIIPLRYDISHEAIVDEYPLLSDLVSDTVSPDTIQDRVQDIYNIVKNNSEDFKQAWEPERETAEDSRTEFKPVIVTIGELPQIDIGDKVTIEEWKIEGRPPVSNIRASEMYDPKRDLTYSTGSALGTKKTMKDYPLTGLVSEIDELGSGKSVFKIQVSATQLDDLPDEYDAYKQGFVQ